MTENLPLTGGCQCGAVRYALHQWPTGPHICHCRMCQKAFGSFFAPLTGVKLDKFEITRGELAIFMSSDEAERGFCRNCGTPLTFHYVGSDRIAVSIGSLDEPERVKPAMQYGIEGRLSYFGELAALPGEKTTEEDEPEKAAAIRRTNHQHPDHETNGWHPGGPEPDAEGR
jgi:hypothetical protein